MFKQTDPADCEEVAAHSLRMCCNSMYAKRKWEGISNDGSNWFFMYARSLGAPKSLRAIPVDVIELNVLILLRYDFSLHLPGGIGSTPNKNEYRRASKPTECSQVSYLFNHCRTRSQHRQEGRTQDRYPAKNLYLIKNQYIMEVC